MATGDDGWLNTGVVVAVHQSRSLGAERPENLKSKYYSSAAERHWREKLLF